jgi:hypothetical protein
VQAAANFRKERREGVVFIFSPMDVSE